jgi:hypothetical protein
MKIDEILDICETIEINEDISFIKDLVNKLGRMPWDSAKRFIKQKAQEFVTYLKTRSDVDNEKVLNMLNTRMGTHFSNMNSIFAKSIVENTNKCDEGLANWWKEASTNMYGALAFYPLLTVFLELDKIVKGTEGASVKVAMVYFVIWLLIVSGKVISGAIGNHVGVSKNNSPSWEDTMRNLENNK